jgi:hypothetical protein
MSGEGFRKALKEEWGCQGVGREHLSVDPQVCFPVGSMQSLSGEFKVYTQLLSGKQIHLYRHLF